MKWISIKDRLPPHKRKVLIYVINEFGGYWDEAIAYNNNGFSRFENPTHIIDGKVTHWMVPHKP